MKSEYKMLPNSATTKDMVEYVEAIKTNIDLFNDSEIQIIESEISDYIESKLQLFGKNVIPLFS